MKAFTDISQSKKLAEILPIESADMKWFIPADDESEFEEEVSFINNKSEYYLFEKVTDWNDTPYIPCWSLAALLNVLPSATLDSSDDHWFRVECNGKFTDWYDNPIDCCIAMIDRLHSQMIYDFNK